VLQEKLFIGRGVKSLFHHTRDAASPTPKAAVQVGLAESSLKLWLDADKHLSEALEAEDDDWVRQSKAVIEKQLALVREHLGSLIITGTPNAEVFVDGVLVGRMPLVRAIRRQEGQAEIQGRLAGHQTVTRRVMVGAGSERTAGLDLPIMATPPIALAPQPPRLPPAAAPKPQDPEPPPRIVYYSWLPWVSMAAGAVSLADALVFDSKLLCSNPSACRPNRALEIGVLLAGTTGLVVGGEILLLEAIRPPDPRMAKAILLVSSAVAAAGAIVAGASLVQGHGSGTRMSSGIGSMVVGGLTLLVDSLALAETTPKRVRPVGIAIVPHLGGLILLGTF